MEHKQRGITFIGFLVVLAVVGFAAFVGMKLFPIYQGQFAVRSAMKSLAEEPGVGQMDEGRIKDLFSRRLEIGYADELLKPENVKLEHSDGGYLLHVTYEDRRSLIYNLDVVGKFDATQALVRQGNPDE